MALTGTGGIGKTSIALTVLNDDRIRRRFGDNRSFIRCDQLTASHTHFLRKLSEVTGAGVGNPEDLSPLRRYLYSKEMIVVLDNAESILGLPETSAQEIHTIVDELSQFSNICLVITSRISNALPSHCEVIEIPTLSMEAGHETFYRIYRRGERSDQISEILKELDFHPLSITLLATVAQQNGWNTKRLAAGWEKQRTGVLHARNLGSLGAAIELSLASPMFQELGPDGRDVLGVIAFFPQGVDEDNVKELFLSMFDTFCNLSLTYRSNGFFTMLAPLRDYLRPKDPMSSPFLRMAKEYYFMRLSVYIYPGKPGFDESRWIMSEDVNVEHLLDVFTSVDADSEEVWGACIYFMHHLHWHKPRLVVLGPKFEALPDNHPFKPNCLFFLSGLLNGVGNLVGQKRMLVQCLGLWRKREDNLMVADTLGDLSDTNRALGLYEEGIQQAKEALDIYGQLGKTDSQAQCLITLASLLREDKQLDAAEEAITRAMDLSGNHDQYKLYRIHLTLGQIHRSKGNPEKAIRHFEESIRIASALNTHDQLSRTHMIVANFYLDERELDKAHTHIESAKSHAGSDTYILGSAFHFSALTFLAKDKPEEAKSEALRALAIFEGLGVTDNMEKTEWLLKRIEEKIQE